MLKILGGTGLGALAATTSVDFHPLTLLLEILGGLAGIGGMMAGAVAIYKARGDHNLTSTQSMALLFEKQREVNGDLLAQRDQEITDLRDRIEKHEGDTATLKRRLAACQRDRQLLNNQIQGLEETIAELRGKPHQKRRDP